MLMELLGLDSLRHDFAWGNFTHPIPMSAPEAFAERVKTNNCNLATEMSLFQLLLARRTMSLNVGYVLTDFSGFECLELKSVSVSRFVRRR